MFDRLSYLEMQTAGRCFSSLGLHKQHWCRAFDLGLCTIRRGLSPPQGGRLRDPSPLQVLLHQILTSAAREAPWATLSLPHCCQGTSEPPALCIPLSVSHGLSPKLRTFLRDSSQIFLLPFPSHPSTRLRLARMGAEVVRAALSLLPPSLPSLAAPPSWSSPSPPAWSLLFILPSPPPD